MKTKLIATILALGMVVGAFAMMATPVRAAAYHGFWYAEIDNGATRIQDSNDGANPNGGVARWWKATEPTYHVQQFNTPGGMPWIGMNDWIGANGQGGGDYVSMMQTCGLAGPTNVLAGDLIYSIMELDDNVATEPRTYYSTVDGPAAYGFTVRGAVPHGYIWAGSHNAIALSDEEVFPSGFPPTTFFELYEMPAVTFTDLTTNNWVFPAHEPTTCGNTAASIQSWLLLQGPAAGDNDGPWTQVGVTQPYGTAITYDRLDNYFYSVRVIWTGGVNSAVLSQPLQELGGPINTAPTVTAAATLPTPHNGTTLTEFVTLTATATDPELDPLTLEYSIDAGAWTTFVSPFQFDFPSPYTEGLHHVDVRAYDGALYSPVVAADFTITDTSFPIAAWISEPTAGFVNSTLTFTADYEDFTDITTALVDTFLSYQVNAGPVQYAAWAPGVRTWGSYVYATMTATISTAGMSAGDSITYNGEVTDTAAGPRTTVLGAGGPIVLADPPVLADPFPVFGAVVLYDGTSAGGYAPIPAGIGVPVTVTYRNASAAIVTIATTTDISGFYTVDIDGAVVGDAYEIEVEAGPFPGYNNMGYNNLPVAAYGVGGVQVDVVCGIPYEVTITAPLTGTIWNAGAPLPVTYQVWDIDGILAQGYFSFEGAMDWTSTDVLYTNPGPTTFEGTVTGGTITQNLVLWTAGLQTIRIADEDGGVPTPPWMPTPGTTLFLTPWGNFGPVLIGGAPFPVFFDDWDEIIIDVQADQFYWNLVANGWNIVSAPTDPISKGTDLVFDADDAMNLCLASDPTNLGLQMATRDIAGTYTVVMLGVGELGAFHIDSVHGYWIYSDVNDIVGIFGLDYNLTADPTLNDVTTTAGWNLLGFTHNYSAAWGAIPTASDFCDGTIGPGMGAATKIVATRWDYTAQWYYSYVRTPTFVMPSRDWAWDFFAATPGNGFYLWTEAPIAIAFPTMY